MGLRAWWQRRQEIRSCPDYPYCDCDPAVPRPGQRMVTVHGTRPVAAMDLPEPPPPPPYGGLTFPPVPMYRNCTYGAYGRLDTRTLEVGVYEEEGEETVRVIPILRQLGPDVGEPDDAESVPYVNQELERLVMAAIERYPNTRLEGGEVKGLAASVAITTVERWLLERIEQHTCRRSYADEALVYGRAPWD